MSCTLPKMRRNALTLMELIVVLMILVALAGILVQLLPSMITRAHTSTSATNTAEVTKQIQLHEATYFTYPDEFDSLIKSGGTTLFAKMPGGAAADLSKLHLAATPLTATRLGALNNAGIFNVWDLDDTTADPTFDPYGAAVAPRALTATGTVATLQIAAKRALGLPVAHEYIVLGVGRKNTMMGRTMTDPPVHFADALTDSADKAYARVAVVFALSKTVTDTSGATTEVDLDRARFVGTASFHNDGVVGTDAHLKEYYGVVNDGGNK